MPEVVTLIPAFLRVLKVRALAGNKARVWCQGGPGANDTICIDLELDGWSPPVTDADPLVRAAGKAAASGLQAWADDLLERDHLWAVIHFVDMDQNGRRTAQGRLVKFRVPTVWGEAPSDLAAGMAAGFRFQRPTDDRAILADIAAQSPDGFYSVARALNESLHAEA